MLGKVVLITGASSGIGAGTATHFASLGCLLSLTGRNETRLRITQKACIEAGCKENDVLLIPTDLQDAKCLPYIVQKTIDKFGRLDVLVNNAGTGFAGNLESTTVDEYDTVMNVNLKSIFILTQNAMPHLIKSKGSVVNVSSIGSQRPIVNFITGGLSKAALDQFTRIVALDVASNGVRVNAVNLGMVKTPMLSLSRVPDIFEQVAPRCHAIGRGGTVEEIAKVIAFLSDNSMSSFVTGATLLADGGWSLMGPL